MKSRHDGTQCQVTPWDGIPHMSVSIGGLTFDAPVAVNFGKRGDIPQLERDGNGYIYALPGGGRIDSNGNVISG